MTTHADVESSPVLTVTLSDILVERDPRSPLFDERAELPLDKDFLASLKKHGQQQPITLYERKTDGAAELVLGDGHQRYNAAIALGWDTILAIVKPLPKSTQVALGQWSNNARIMDRPDLRAAKVRRQVKCGESKESIAVAAGVSLTRVNQWLRWEKLPDEVKARVLSNGKDHLSFDAALEMLPKDAKKVEASTKRTDGKAKGAGKTARESDGAEVASNHGKTEDLVEAVAALLATLAVGDVPAGTARMAYKAVAETYSALTEG